MRRGMFLGVGLLCALTLMPGPALAQAGQAAAPAAAPAGFKAEFFVQFDDAATKLTRLAEAMPAESYTWRPMEGVRSVSEVYMHVASGSYGFARSLGTPPPAGLNMREFAALTDKAKVLESMKASFEHLRTAVMNIPDADMEKQIPFRGRQAPIREVLLAVAVHMHEHLGQSIAYSRMNKITPPWTAEREEQQRQQPAKKQP